MKLFSKPTPKGVEKVSRPSGTVEIIEWKGAIYFYAISGALIQQFSSSRGV